MGTYTVMASATGYLDGTRPDPVTVTDGATSWGSTMVLVSTGTSDTDPPVVTLTAPVDGLSTDVATVQVSGTVADASAIASLTVSGTPVVVTSGAFSYLLTK